jgi:hypothetical protein
MTAASFFAQPAVIGLLVGLPSAALGYLAYRQSQKKDKIAEQAGIATVESGTIGQVIGGLNDLVGRLQEDNAILRTKVDHLNEKLDLIIAQCEELKAEIAALKARPA